MASEKALFPDEFSFENITYIGQADTTTNQLLIPFKDRTCPFDIGEKILLRQGAKMLCFDILDYEMRDREVGGSLPYMAIIHVNDIDS
jgi:hypothetical protein